MCPNSSTMSIRRRLSALRRTTRFRSSLFTCRWPRGLHSLCGPCPSRTRTRRESQRWVAFPSWLVLSGWNTPLCWSPPLARCKSVLPTGNTAWYAYILPPVQIFGGMPQNYYQESGTVSHKIELLSINFTQSIHLSYGQIVHFSGHASQELDLRKYIWFANCYFCHLLVVTE